MAAPLKWVLVFVALLLAFACISEGQLPSPQCPNIGADECYCGSADYCQTSTCCSYSNAGIGASSNSSMCCSEGMNCTSCQGVFFCCESASSIACGCAGYTNLYWVADFNVATKHFNNGKITHTDLVVAYKTLMMKHRAAPEYQNDSGSDYSLSSGDLAGVVLGSFFGGTLFAAIVAVVAAVIIVVGFKLRAPRNPETLNANYVAMQTNTL